MKVHVLAIGKTKEKYLSKGIEEYLKRLKHYVNLTYTEYQGVKNFSGSEDLQIKEGEYILSKVKERDYLVLLDENGQMLSSKALAKEIENWQLRLRKDVWLVIGGAYGFSTEVKSRADMVLSLSKMTFTHQMVRLFLLEQIYRSFTIIRGEKYHNS